jgi:hypothetical protein
MGKKVENGSSESVEDSDDSDNLEALLKKA